MKKLFVLFLLVALVPFSVGCSLWGNDEDLDVLDLAKVTVSAKLPASAVVSGSLLSALPVTAASPITLTIGTYVFSGTMTGPVDGFYNVTFVSGNLSAAERATLTDTTADTAVIKVGNDEVYSFPLTLGSTSSVVITISEAGAVSAVTAAGTTTSTATIGEAVTENAMNVTMVKFGANELPTAVTTPTVVNTLTPTFAVTYDNDIETLTNVTWKIDVTHVTDAGVTVKAYSLDSTVAADKALFTTNNDAASATVNVTLVAAAAPKNLENGNIYKVKLTATSLKSTKGGLAAIDGKEYFFKIAL